MQPSNPVLLHLVTTTTKNNWDSQLGWIVSMNWIFSRSGAIASIRKPKLMAGVFTFLTFSMIYNMLTDIWEISVCETHCSSWKRKKKLVFVLKLLYSLPIWRCHPLKPDTEKSIIEYASSVIPLFLIIFSNTKLYGVVDSI